MNADQKSFSFWFFSVAFLVVTTFLFLSIPVSASPTDNINGWAWSDNVGWISFNCTTGGPTANNICANSNYGVTNTTGNITGYAWSDNVGWIKFGGFSLSELPNRPSAEGTNRINATVVGNHIEGWARACSGTSNPSTCSDAVVPTGTPTTIVFDYGATTPVAPAGVTNTGNGTYTWTVPAGVTSFVVETWGAGGSGGGQQSSYPSARAGGGGGGGYASSTFTGLTGVHQIIVGRGGPSTGTYGTGTAGGESRFDNLIRATGGLGGQYGPYQASGAGGVGGVGYGQISISGEDGHHGDTYSLTENDGCNGGLSSNPRGGRGANNGGLGGYTMYGATFPNAYNVGCNRLAQVPGGGGGGANSYGPNSSGAAADGRVTITYTPGPTIPSIFADGVPYVGGISQTSAVTGDIDGDSDKDMLVVNRYSNSVSVFKNNGDGTFANKVDITTTANPYSIALGDFNGDNRPDFVITHVSNITSSELMNIYLNNGSGGFTHGQDYDTGGVNAFSVKTGYLNADGHLDIAVVGGLGGTGSITTFVGTGTGTFGSRTIIPDTGGYPYDVVLKDLNGDGRLDMAAPASAGQLAVYINSAVTPGTFAANVLYSGLPGAPTIESGDFNGDGTVDLIASVFGNSSLYANNGSGVFTRTTSNVNLKPGFKLADVNADGRIDAISVDAASKVSVYLGNNTGNFTVEKSYAASSVPSFVATGDFNADNKIDFVVTDNSNTPRVNVFLNTFTPATVFTDPRGGWDGWISLKGTSTASPFSPYSVLVTNTGFSGTPVSAPATLSFATRTDYPGGGGQRYIGSKDLDGDGDKDIVVVNAANTNFSVFKNDGSGNFAPRVNYSTGANVNYNPASGLIVDLNADNRPDIVTTETLAGYFSVFLNDGNGAFPTKADTYFRHIDSPTTNYDMPGKPHAVTSADFNGDGRPDLAISDYYQGVAVFLNNGSGVFTKSAALYYSGRFMSVAAGDFNGDGNQDVALANDYIASVRVYPGAGNGTFGTSVDFPVGTTGTWTGATSIAAGNLNSDSKPDIVVSGGVTSVLINNATGATISFLPKVDYAIGVDMGSNYGNQLTLGDVNSDGKLDIALAATNVNLATLINNSDGTFKTPAYHLVNGQPIGVVVADFDGDSKNDLASVGLSTYMSVLLNNSLAAPASTGGSFAWGSDILGWIDFSGAVSPFAPVTNPLVNTSSFCSSQTLNFTWDRMPGVTNYTLYRFPPMPSTVIQNRTFVSQPASGATVTFADTAVPPSGGYYYQLFANYPSGISATSSSPTIPIPSITCAVPTVDLRVRNSSGDWVKEITIPSGTTANLKWTVQ